MDKGVIRKQAWQHSLNGEYDEAILLLESLLRQDAGDLISLRLMGNTLDLFAASSECLTSSRGESIEDALVRAQECYQRILAIDPHNKHALRDLADSLIGRDDYDSAKELYDRLASLTDLSSLDEEEELAELAGALETLKNLREQ